MRASEGGGIQGGTMGSPIGAFFWALFCRGTEKRHSYRPVKRDFCILLIVLDRQYLCSLHSPTNLHKKSLYRLLAVK